MGTRPVKPSLVWVVFLAALLTACASDPHPVAREYSETDPVGRCHLVGQLTEKGSPGDQEQLVKLLDDPDVVVRWRAVRALRRLTGLNMDYDPTARRRTRLRAMSRWQQRLGIAQTGLEESSEAR